MTDRLLWLRAWLWDHGFFWPVLVAINPLRWRLFVARDNWMCRPWRRGDRLRICTICIGPLWIQTKHPDPWRQFLTSPDGGR